MSLTDTDVGLFKDQLAHCTDLWREFRKWRQIYDDVIRRRAPATMPPALAPYAGAGMQSVDLEVAINEFVSVLMLNPTKIGAVSLDKRVRAQADIDDLRIYLASSWLRQNDGRKLDKARFQSMTRYGFAARRKFARMPPEPASGEMPNDVPGAIAWAERTMEERDRHFREGGHHPFSSQWVSPLEMSWFPLDNPEVVFQDSIIPWIEARQLTNGLGQFVNYSEASGVHFVGDPQPLAEFGGTVPGQMKNFHFVVRDALDKKTGLWMTSEYIYPDGGELFKDGEKLTDYVNPFGRSCYFICASGNEQLTEYDPHLRYRPPIYALLNDVMDWNTLTSMLLALVNLKISDEHLVLDASQIRPEMMSQLEEIGLVQEGIGGKKRLTWRPPVVESGEVAVSPGPLSVWPGDLEPHLIKMLEITESSMRRHMPNRFLLGRQVEGEAKGATATAWSLQLQAARLPFGLDLVNADLDTKDDLKAEEAAICYWDKDVAEGSWKKYPHSTTGDEPVTSNPREPGEQITIDAGMVKIPHLLFATTAGETQAEQAEEKADAYNDYAQGTIDKAQLLRRLGHEDTDRQLELLEERRLEELYEQEVQETEKALMRTKLAALSGMNLAMMAGQSTVPSNGDRPPADTVEPVGRQPNVALPPLGGPEGGASPMGGELEAGVV